MSLVKERKQPAEIFLVCAFPDKCLPKDLYGFRIRNSCRIKSFQDLPDGLSVVSVLFFKGVISAFCFEADTALLQGFQERCFDISGIAALLKILRKKPLVPSLSARLAI